MIALSLVGLGTFLPERVRTNADWPRETVNAWMQHGAFSPERAREALAAEDDGTRATLDAMHAYTSDPFAGSVERRVMGDDMTAADMGVLAARAALRDAAIDPSAVDFLLSSAFVPDLLNTPEACGIHRALGMRDDVFVMTADAVCNSFQMQLALAEGLLKGERFSRGLLVQTTAASRITPMAAPFSVHFGDGATAVVVERGTSRRLLAQRFESKTSIYRAMVATVPGKNWWEEGRVWATPLDKEAARRMIPETAEVARRLLHAALDDAGARPEDVGFFACHQPTVWFRKVIQEFSGLTNAASLDTYPEAGTISAGNLPLILDRARAQGLLREGMLVALFQAGTGATYGATLLQW